MNDSELRYLLELAEGPIEPSEHYVDRLWSELEAHVEHGQVEVFPSRSPDHPAESRPIDLVQGKGKGPSISGVVISLGAAAAVILLGLSTVLLTLARSPGTGPVTEDAAIVEDSKAELSRPEAGVLQATSPLGRACDSFSTAPVSAVVRSGAVRMEDSGYLVEADVTLGELRSVADAIDQLGQRLDGLGQVDGSLLSSLDRADSAIDEAALLVRMGELELAYESIREARGELARLASEPTLVGCFASTGLTGIARPVSHTPTWD